jgi:hypothetical protein
MKKSTYSETQIATASRQQEVNRKLKQLVADLTVDKVILQEALSKSTEAHKQATRVREVVDITRSARDGRLGCSSSYWASWYDRHHRRAGMALQRRLRELA